MRPSKVWSWRSWRPRERAKPRRNLLSLSRTLTTAQGLSGQKAQEGQEAVTPETIAAVGSAESLAPPGFDHIFEERAQATRAAER